MSNQDDLINNAIEDYIQGEQQKYSQWKQSSREYFKDRSKHKGSESWSSNSNRLPTSEEIASQRGWPSESDETKLKRVFFTSFRSAVEKKLGEENLAKVDEVLGLLYGVYLVNYITGGLLINKYFDYYSFQKWDMNQWQFQTANLDPNNLDDWPVVFNMTNSRSSSNYNNLFGISIQIEVGVARYVGHKPYEQQIVSFGEREIIRKSFLGLGRKKVKTPVIQFSISAVDEAVLTGIEEAHHSLLTHLKVVQGIKLDTSALRSNSLIETIDTVDATSSINDYFEFQLMYSASRTKEYAADQCQAIYVRRYLPHTWQEGYQQFIEAIHRKRRSLKDN